MNNGDARDTGTQLLTVEQASTIVLLLQRIGIDLDSFGMLMAQQRVGGTGTPYGYLLLNRAQAHQLIQLMGAYLRSNAQQDAPSVSGEEMSA